MSNERPDGGAGVSRIHVLPVTLANQIAAGEVVERPASVLKELLENSLDAGAHRVEVELEHGGSGLIKVLDDGVGLHSGDLVLALRRHATSKINSLGDLEAVASLGFRGEALPSIASVARLELSSRPVGAEQAFRVVADGAAEPDGPEPAALASGTLVVVRDLFFNTPARRKFLRTEKTEFRHADEVMRRVALSRDDVDFRLVHNGRSVWSVRAASTADARLKRVGKLCGQSFCDHALAIDFEGHDLRLSGWVALPSYARAQPDLQHFFLNGRMVRDRVVSHALRQAYAENLPPDGHPSYVLYLSMDPRSVDVNVHPAKHEVRFRESRSVHDFLLRAVGRALQRDTEPLLPPEQSSTATALPMETSREPESAPTHSRHRVRDQIAGYARLGSVGGTERSNSVHAAAVVGERTRYGRALSQIQGRFLVASDDDCLIVIDWRHAHELIIRRRLLSAIETDGAVASKPLLIPTGVVMSDAQVEILESQLDLLAVVGIEVRVLGPQNISLRQVPTSLSQVQVGDVLGALASALGPGTRATHVDVVDVLARCSAEAFVLPSDRTALSGCLHELERAALPDERLRFVKVLDVSALEELLIGHKDPRAQ